MDTEPMVRCKIAYYDAVSQLLTHVNDPEEARAAWPLVYKTSEAYLQSLLDLETSITENTRYRQGLRKEADRIRPFVFELQIAIGYHHHGEFRMWPL